MYQELSSTLLALVEAVKTPPDSGLIVTEADIEVPLEIRCAPHEGALVFFANAPHSRWQSGVLPEVHLGRIKVALEEA